MPIIPDAWTTVQLLTGLDFSNGLDDLTAAKTGNGSFAAAHAGYPQALQQLYVHEEGRIGGATFTPIDENGGIQSLWQNDGGSRSGGVIPGSTWSNPTNATIGSLGQASPGGGRSQFLIDLVATLVGAGGILWIYDRLGHCGGMSGTTFGSAQNTNGGSAGGVTRFTSSTTNFLAAEIFQPVGTTATTLTASYTNQSNVAGQSTQPVQFAGNTVRFQTGAFIILSLAAGDSGVLAATSATLAASTGTAGSFGLVIGQMLAAVSFTTNGQMMAHSFMDGPMPQLPAGACVSFAAQGAPTNVAVGIEAFIEIAEK